MTNQGTTQFGLEPAPEAPLRDLARAAVLLEDRELAVLDRPPDATPEEVVLPHPTRVRYVSGSDAILAAALREHGLRVTSMDLSGRTILKGWTRVDGEAVRLKLTDVRPAPHEWALLAVTRGRRDGGRWPFIKVDWTADTPTDPLHATNLLGRIRSAVEAADPVAERSSDNVVTANGMWSRLIDHRERRERSRPPLKNVVSALNASPQLVQVMAWGKIYLQLSGGWVAQIAPAERAPGPDWQARRLESCRTPRAGFALLRGEWRSPGGFSTDDHADSLPQFLNQLEEISERQTADREAKQNGLRKLSCGTGGLPSLLRDWTRITREQLILTSRLGIASLIPIGEDLWDLTVEEAKVLRKAVAYWQKQAPDGRVNWQRRRLRLEQANPESGRVLDYQLLTLIPPSESELQAGRVRVQAHPRGEPKLRAAAGSGAGWDLYLPDTTTTHVRKGLDGLGEREQYDPPIPVDRVGVLSDLLAITAETADRLPPRAGWFDRPLPAPLPPKFTSDVAASQAEAVRLAVNTPDVAMIQGPPGTGKTTVIAEVLWQLYKRAETAGRTDFRVLLVAPQHVAVDNVLLRLIEPGDDGGPSVAEELGVLPYRVGRGEKIAPQAKAFTLDSYRSGHDDDRREGAAGRARQLAEGAADAVDATNFLQQLADASAVRWGDSPDLVPSVVAPAPPTKLEQDYPSGWPASQFADPVTLRSYLGRTFGPNPQKTAALASEWADAQRTSGRFGNLLARSANLVLGTTIGISSAPGLKRKDVPFDVVIADEAGREQARRLLVPMVRAAKWVLVGDDAQLPPHVDDELLAAVLREGIDERRLKDSVFHLCRSGLEAAGRVVSLNYQGRMHPDIGSFVSQEFYGGNLSSFPGLREARASSLPGFLEAAAPADPAPALLVLDTRDLPDREERSQGTGFVNQLEASLAVRLLAAFATSTGWEAQDFGMISGYGKQVGLMNTLFEGERERGTRLPHDDRVQVGTIDGFQGQEKDLILLSITRSNKEGKMGFLEQFRRVKPGQPGNEGGKARINVALSRAKRRLIVVGDGDTIERAAGRVGAEEPDAGWLANLLTYARKTGGLIRVPEDWRERWAK